VEELGEEEDKELREDMINFSECMENTWPK